MSGQDRPESRGIDVVGPAALVRGQPGRLVVLGHSHVGCGQVRAQEGNQPVDHDRRDDVRLPPTERTQRPVDRGVDDHLSPRLDAVRGRPPHDARRRIGNGHAGVADRQAGVGPAGESAAGSERPLTERLAVREPAREGVPLEVLRRRTQRVRSACGRRRAPRHDDPIVVDHGPRPVRGLQRRTRRADLLQPADDVGRRPVRQPDPDHPALTRPGPIERGAVVHWVRCLRVRGWEARY